MKILTAKRFDVFIARGITENIRKTVWAHEIPILENINGAGSVVIDKDGKDYPMEEIDNKDVGEFERLGRTYGVHKERGIPNVEFVYGNEYEGRLEKFYEQLENNISRFRAEKPVEKLEANEVSVGKIDVRFLNPAGVKAKLSELGIQYKPNEKIEDLAEKLEMALLDLQEKQPVEAG